MAASSWHLFKTGHSIYFVRLLVYFGWIIFEEVTGPVMGGAGIIKREANIEEGYFEKEGASNAFKMSF